VIPDRFRHPVTAVAAAILLTVPWVGVYLTGAFHDWDPLAVVTVSGLAVLGASFLLAWGAETAEEDVPRAFALAVLAVLAVAPEYAVDALYAWGAGSKGATREACATLTPEQIEAGATALARGCHEGNLAVANMTGANRILIGLGWAGIAAFTVWQAHRTSDPAVEERAGWLSDLVHLDRDLATEITFLFLATAWAFFVPLGGGIGAVDMLILVGIYVAYIGIIIRSDVDADTEHVGVPAHLQSYRRPVRVLVVLALFVFSGFLILTAVEPFAHGLESLGTAIGVPSFFMIQWIAPLASESPELIVVAVLVYKARSTAGFNALISSKLNQWTLLIGTLVVVYSLALGQYGVLPFDVEQTGEIWLTAAQSFFALAILVDFTISVREAVLLFVLFISQVLLEFVFLKIWAPFPDPKIELLLVYTAVYVVLGTALFVRRRGALRRLLGLAGDAAWAAVGRGARDADRAD
jgi:cation:H+ antiporter